MDNGLLKKVCSKVFCGHMNKAKAFKENTRVPRVYLKSRESTQKNLFHIFALYRGSQFTVGGETDWFSTLTTPYNGRFLIKN